MERLTDYRTSSLGVPQQTEFYGSSRKAVPMVLTEAVTLYDPAPQDDDFKVTVAGGTWTEYSSKRKISSKFRGCYRITLEGDNEPISMSFMVGVDRSVQLYDFTENKSDPNTISLRQSDDINRKDAVIAITEDMSPVLEFIETRSPKSYINYIIDGRYLMGILQGAFNNVEQEK